MKVGFVWSIKGLGWLISFEKLIFEIDIKMHFSAFSIWCVWLHVHTPENVVLVWCVWKIARANSVYDIYCLGLGIEEYERKVKNIKLNSYQSFLTFVNLSLT